MRIIFIFGALLIFIAGFCISKEMPQKTKSVQYELDKIYEEIAVIKKDAAFSKTSTDEKFKVVDMTSASISNQIATASFVVGIFSVLFAVFGVLIGVFVSRIQRKTEEAEQRAEEAEKRAENARVNAEGVLGKVNLAKQDVDLVFHSIENNISEIYKKIKREETDYILNRIRKEPRDIANFFEVLATRDLIGDDYFVLKKGLASFSDDSEDGKDLGHIGHYQILLLQHFPGKSIYDDEVYPRLKNEYQALFGCLFKHEVELAINDVIILGTRDFQIRKDRLLEFILKLKDCRLDISAEIDEYITSAINSNSLKSELNLLFTPEV